MKSEGQMKNGQSRDTGNIGYTKPQDTKGRQIKQNTKIKRWQTPPKTRGELVYSTKNEWAWTFNTLARYNWLVVFYGA